MSDDLTDLLSRKEIVEYLRKENYETEIVDIIDNFPPTALPPSEIVRLQARTSGGPWIDIFPSQLQWMAKWYEVRADQQSTVK